MGLQGLAALYQSLGMTPSEEALKIALKQMDTKGYGAVSLQEF